MIQIQQRNGRTDVFWNGKRVTNPFFKNSIVYGSIALGMTILLATSVAIFYLPWKWLLWGLGCIVLIFICLVLVSLLLRLMGKGGFQIKRSQGQTAVSLFGKIKQTNR